ncbi:uncharacterized protein [Sylvia atricapilla]|uniref:uncharacterized protein n=1 Tax=Sylvia atricapilla TaxID=48155 RepID=UPI0033992336
MQERTMTAQMLLDMADPDVFGVTSSREYHRLGSFSLVGSTEGATALDRQKEMPTPLPGGDSEREEMPWITHSAGQRHLSSAGDLSNTLQGFPVHKGSEVDISLWPEKPITSPAPPAHRFLTRSLQGKLTARRDQCGCETVLKVQNQEEMANPSPGESLRIWDSLSFQPSATLSTDSFEQDLGEEDFGGTELEDKHRRHLNILRQRSLLLAHRLKLQQKQQKHQLMVLREKAKQEVEESHRFLRDLLQLSPEDSRNPKGSDPPVTRLYHTEQPQRGHWLEGDLAAGRSRAAQPSHFESVVTLGESAPQGDLGQLWREQLQQPDTLLYFLSFQNSLRGSFSGLWSAAIPHLGSSRTFCGSRPAVVEQCLRGEELWAVLLQLQRKILQERRRAQLGHRER